MLCGSDNGMESAELAHGPDSGHTHHADMHHEGATHDQSSSLDQSSSDCASECECGHCNVTVALNDSAPPSVVTYRSERAVKCDSNLSPYLPSIFRPPISS